MTLGVTVGSRYAEVLLLRGKQRGITAVVVEGSSDSRAYRRVLDNSVHLIWLNGKDEVLALLSRFSDTKIAGTLGIIDADHDRLFNRRRQANNVFWTSHTDLESMVFSSSAYLRATSGNVDELTRRKRRDLLLQAAVPLGCLRLLSRRENLSLDFKLLVFGAFIDSAGIACDERACCEQLLEKNPQSPLKVDDCLNELADMHAFKSDPLAVVNGHDVCRIAQLCSLRLFGRIIPTSEAVFEGLVKKYSFSDFQVCSTYQELSEWQRTNSGFKVVPISESSPTSAGSRPAAGS